MPSALGAIGAAEAEAYGAPYLRDEPRERLSPEIT
jgi:hypothetical protein